MPDVKIDVTKGMAPKESGRYRQESSKPYNESLPDGGVVRQDTKAGGDMKKKGDMPGHTYAKGDKLISSKKVEGGIDALRSGQSTPMPGSSTGPFSGPTVPREDHT